MKIKDIETRVSSIENISNVDAKEATRQLFDLYESVLESIADNVSGAKGKATEALKARDIYFSRKM